MTAPAPSTVTSDAQVLGELITRFDRVIRMTEAIGDQLGECRIPSNAFGVLKDAHPALRRWEHSVGERISDLSQVGQLAFAATERLYRIRAGYLAADQRGSARLGGSAQIAPEIPMPGAPRTPVSPAPAPNVIAATIQVAEPLATVLQTFLPTIGAELPRLLTHLATADPGAIHVAAARFNPVADGYEQVDRALLEFGLWVQSGWRGRARDAFDAWLDRFRRYLADIRDRVRRLAGATTDAANRIQASLDESQRQLARAAKAAMALVEVCSAVASGGRTLSLRALLQAGYRVASGKAEHKLEEIARAMYAALAPVADLNDYYGGRRVLQSHSGLPHQLSVERVPRPVDLQ